VKAMELRSMFLVLGLVLGLALPSLALGQSMGEAARKEAERREKNKKDGVKAKAYGDEDLKEEPPPGQGTDDPSARPGSGLSESEWRKRVGAARLKRDRAKAAHDLLTKVRPTPAEADDLRRWLAESKALWDAAERDLERLFEEARRARVPPAWLR
jgi:hypothetical protein